MNRTITVGIADFNVAKDGDVLVTYALGSCVGICLFDSINKIAGMSHIMLPESKGFAPNAKEKGKFADLAIELLLRRMEAEGAKKLYIRAKIAGGAQMFGGLANNALANIGERNAVAVKKELSRLGIALVAEDTGQNYGRTQWFSSADGQMTIKSVNRGEWIY